MKYKQGETGRAYAAAGWRERYAMENGKPSICYPNGNKCIKYNYGKKDHTKTQTAQLGTPSRGGGLIKGGDSMTYYKTYNIYDLRHAPRVIKRTITSDKTADEVLRACLPKSAPVSIEQDGEKAVARLWGCVCPVMVVRPDSTAERESRETARRDALILIIKKAIADNSGQLCPDDDGVFLDCNDIDHAAEESADEIIKRGLL